MPDLRKTIKRIVVHTTDWDVTPEELAAYDIGPNHISNTGCPTITYHYLIEQDGRVVKAADHEWVTWHVGNWNRGSLGVALVYKTDPAYEKAKVKGKPTPPLADEHMPSGKMNDSMIWLLVQLCIHEGVPPNKIFGHRELYGTGWFNDKGSKRLRKTCPGMAVDMDRLRQRVTIALQTELQRLGLYGGDIDGNFGKMSKGALTRAECHSQLPTSSS
jgi:N-acetyl-anhydromuramyl-L-alanine amidase AmpD